jgi:hypothetical protein
MEHNKTIYQPPTVNIIEVKTSIICASTSIICASTSYGFTTEDSDFINGYWEEE